MRVTATALLLGVLLLTSWLAATPASAKYRHQCGSILSFRDGTNHKIKYAVVTGRSSRCRSARRTMSSYLSRVGRNARAGRCNGARCTNAAPRGWRCALTSYSARHRGRLADCTRKHVSIQALVWPPV